MTFVKDHFFSFQGIKTEIKESFVNQKLFLKFIMYFFQLLTFVVKSPLNHSHNPTPWAIRLKHQKIVFALVCFTFSMPKNILQPYKFSVSDISAMLKRRAVTWIKIKNSNYKLCNFYPSIHSI